MSVGLHQRGLQQSVWLRYTRQTDRQTDRPQDRQGQGNRGGGGGGRGTATTGGSSRHRSHRMSVGLHQRGSATVGVVPLCTKREGGEERDA